MPDKMSFMPDDYLEDKVARRTNIICITLFIIVMAAVVAGFYITDQQRTEVSRELNEVNSQFKDKAEQLDQIEKLQNQKEQMIRKARVTAVLVERIPRSMIMAELINHMPATLSLLEFELDTKKVRNAPRPRTALEREKLNVQNRQDQEQYPEIVDVQPTEVSIIMVGVAPTDVEVSEFMAALSAHPLFYDVNLQFSEQVSMEDQEMRKFRVELMVDQEADIEAIKPTMVRRGLKQNPMSDKIQIDSSGRMVAPSGKVSSVDTD